MLRVVVLTVVLAVAWCEPSLAADQKASAFRSHRPVRPLATASDRPLANGPAFFVDAGRGDDTADGSREHPWKSVNAAVERLKPGETLYLRGGTYYEQVKVTSSGTPEKPITLRSYPGEIAVLDGGFREFFETPEAAWEPVAGGNGDSRVPETRSLRETRQGEFRSTRTYPGVERAVGNFGDSMIPLHAYRFAADLRETNEAPLRDENGERKPLYLGPGVWYEAGSQRIHVRLAATHIRAFGPDGNYRGESDPRKLPLVVAAWNSAPLTIDGARHVRVQDVVIRGGGDNSVLVRKAGDVEFDGVTVFAANRGMRVETTGRLRIVHSAFRGPMPPWGSRTASKYRTLDSHLFVPLGTYNTSREEREYLTPQCHDFEIAHCEFTDGHDGVYVGGVQRLRFHHNLVDNMNDDGVYLSAWGPPGSDVRIYHNRLSRCLTLFAFGLGRGSESDPGTGTYIYRNVIDLRDPVPYQHPLPDAPALTSFGRLCSDHGGPVWEPINFYHNTVLSREPAFRGYYGAGWGGHMRGTKRRVFNNLFVQVTGLPGLNFAAADGDLQVDANLHWSLEAGPQQTGDFFQAFSGSPIFAQSRKRYPPGWCAHDLFADPRLRGDITASDSAEDVARLDVRLSGESPAVDAGIDLPADWPLTLRDRDRGRPDLGALPLGAGSATTIGPAAPRGYPGSQRVEGQP